MRAKIFISYSHRDEEYKKQLEGHLAPLKNQELIDAWSDRMIVPGAEGDNVISAALDEADIILLLISSDFCNSLYCWERELEESLRKHETHQAIVIPIILRAVDLEGASFGVLQSLPTDRKPVSAWSDRDEAWTNVARGIRKAVDTVRDLHRRKQVSRELEHLFASPPADTWADGGLQLGFRVVDGLLSGLAPSELLVVAGRPGMGKTSLALNFALNVAFSKERSVPVAIFSLENSGDAVRKRLLSIMARESTGRLRSGSIGEDAWPRIDAALSLLRNAPIYVDETANIGPQDILTRATKLKKEKGLGLMVIDPLQMLRADPRSNRTNETSAIVRDLKSIARQLSVPIVLTSQVISSVDRRVEKRPLISDLPKDCDVDAYADIVMFVFREEMYDPHTVRRGLADVIVAKNRNGDTGELNLVFSPAHGKFDDYVGQPVGDEGGFR
jgi:replicative DNA helicase